MSYIEANSGDFEFYHNIRLSKLKEPDNIFLRLIDIYHTIPKTKGCLDNIGGCGGWCCQIQTPQLFYSEFLMIWNYVANKWCDDEICHLFEKCMMNVVSNIPSKGCVFFDEDTKLCRIHEVRPYNCRIYGITPDDEFKPRYNRLKEEYKNIVGAVLKPQCDLVSTTDGSKIKVRDTNRWLRNIKKVENILGIPKRLMTDEPGGSYRTPHDHILLYNMPDNILNLLMGVKMYDDHGEKIKAIKVVMSCIQGFFKKASNNGKKSKS